MEKKGWVIKEIGGNNFITDDFDGELDVTENVLEAAFYESKEEAEEMLQTLYESDIYADWCSDDCEGEWEVKECKLSAEIK